MDNNDEYKGTTIGASAKQNSNPSRYETDTSFMKNEADIMASTTKLARTSENNTLSTPIKKRERCETITRFVENDEGTSSFATNADVLTTGNSKDMSAQKKRCETITSSGGEEIPLPKKRERCETITKFVEDEGASTSTGIVNEPLASLYNLPLYLKRERCETITNFPDEDEDMMLAAAIEQSQWPQDENVGTLDLRKTRERREIKPKPTLSDNDNVLGIYTSKGRREKWTSVTNFVEEEENIMIAAAKAYSVWVDHETFYTMDLSKNREDDEAVTDTADKDEGMPSSATIAEIPSESCDDMTPPKKRNKYEAITCASTSAIINESHASSHDDPLCKKRDRCETITNFPDEGQVGHSKWEHNDSTGTLDLRTRKKRARCETITKIIDSDEGTSSPATNADEHTDSADACPPTKKREICETAINFTVDEGTSSFATNVDMPLASASNIPAAEKQEKCETITSSAIIEGSSSFATNIDVLAGSTADLPSPKPEGFETIIISPSNEDASSSTTNVELLAGGATDEAPSKPEGLETITNSISNEGTSLFATNVDVPTGCASEIPPPKVEGSETITTSTNNEETATASVAVDLRCGASIARGHEEDITGVNQYRPGNVFNNNQMAPTNDQAPPVRCPGCPLQEPVIPPYTPRRRRESGDAPVAVQVDPLPHGEIRERMLELRSIIERSLVNSPPTIVQRVQCENQLRERMAELKNIIERSMEKMQEADTSDVAAPAKRQKEALIRMRSGYDGMMLYETRIFLSNKGTKKVRRKRRPNRASQSKILHLSPNTGLTREDLIRVTHKIQKRFMRARKNMCEFCHNQGMAKIYITVIHEDTDDEYSMQMILINAARMPPQRLPRIPARFLN